MNKEYKFLISVQLLLTWFAIALICGPIGALTVHLFLKALVFLTRLHKLSSWILCCLPIIGGLLVGLIIYFVDKNVAGDGMSLYIAAARSNQKKITLKTAFAKIVATLTTVASGGAGTLVGPIALITGGIGNSVYHLFKVMHGFFSAEQYKRKFTVCMAAGALGAILGAPIAGGILAAEVVYSRSINYEDVFPGILAGCTGFLVSVIFGSVQRYNICLPASFTWKMLLPVIIVGIACGMFSHFFIRMKMVVEKFFLSLHVPLWVKPALGGAMVSLLFLIFRTPQVLGTGMSTLHEMLMNPGNFGIIILILFIVLRMTAVIFTVTSGGSAGFTGTSIILGGAIGLLIAKAIGYFYPVNNQMMMITGISAVLAGVVNVPFSAMILVVEVFGWGHIFPGAFGSIIGYIMVRELVIYEYQGKRIKAPEDKRLEELKKRKPEKKVR